MKVWEMINEEMSFLNVHPETEDYGEVLDYKLELKPARPQFELFEEALEDYFEGDAGGAGLIRWSGMEDYPGFRLGLDGNLVHMAGFGVSTNGLSQLLPVVSLVLPNI
jgi:hypothetical protein